MERSPAFDRLLALLVLAAWALVVASAVAAHEPWFDEAQSWLLARDASVVELLVERLRYEGHPPLWYLLLKPLAALGAPYAAGNVLSALFGLLGVGLLLAHRETPLFLRLLLPFGFFVAFQYSVIARSYALVFPILMAILHLYPRRRERIVLFSIVLALLANVSLHGLGMAGAFAALYLWDAWRDGTRPGDLDHAERRRHLLAAAILGVTALVVVLVLKPPPDLGVPPIEPTLDPLVLGRLLANITASFLFKANAFSLAAWLVIVAFFVRRRVFLVYALLTLANLAVASIYYSAWHEGLFFFALLFPALLAFRREPDDESFVGAPSRFDRALRIAAITVVALVLANHVRWSVETLRYDLSEPFSGAPAMARHLQELDLDGRTLYATSFPCLALQPYFDEPLFDNYRPAGDFTFFDWSKNALLSTKRRGEVTPADLEWIDRFMAEALAESPDYFLASRKYPHDRRYFEHLREDGRYRPIRASEGAIFWKTTPLESDSYVLFARTGR